ncbi:MAG: FAD-binding dehydrogenase [Hyphomicrobiaceae bacterium]|nr:FAD-binding dehydrogenase [Hyphomicrobiaceae bacterium]
MADNHKTDIVIIGAGLAGLVAACEALERGRKVTVLDQEPEASLGGQAFWSFGGLFFVDSSEQRRMKIKDSYDLALQDWLGTAAFDRAEDHWPRQWAEAYVGFAAGEKRSWLASRGLKFFPVVGWAERGGYGAIGHGNSVPRFHVTWGTGPAIIEPFIFRAREAVKSGRLKFLFRHRVTALTQQGNTITGVTGEILEPSTVARAEPSSRLGVGNFALEAQAVIVASGGIGGNHDLVRKQWPSRLGTPPAKMLSGVPHHVDGLMLGITEQSGARLINRDRMWHYVEGVENHSPIWPLHGIRILPGPSSLWFDALGRRLPVPLFPGFDTLGTLEHITKTGFDYSWFVTNRTIVGKEFALSGSEQNPDLTSKIWLKVIERARKKISAPVQAFLDKGPDFIVADNVDTLITKMNALTSEARIDPAAMKREIEARDREIENPFSKDMQVVALRGARNYLGDKLIRTAAPHRILDNKFGPLVAVRLNILTRKSLGGLETDLDARVLGHDGQPMPGLYAAGEASGFGGGGVHGYRALEGTFLGGCIFSGRAAGRAAAAAMV